jgi:hypothetical protein
MHITLFDHRRIRQAIAILLLSGTLLCIFPPDQPQMLYWANNAVYVALGYLSMGLFFFFINRTRLMYVCMGCSAAICFYYLETAPTQPLNIPQIPNPDTTIMTNPSIDEHTQKDN